MTTERFYCPGCRGVNEGNARSCLYCNLVLPPQKKLQRSDSPVSHHAISWKRPSIEPYERADLDHQKAAMERIRAMLANPKPPSKDWAHELKKREESGEALSLAQSSAWRGVLANNDGEPPQ